ncbi:MAG: choice-of-anchor Q domain-containing protein [bacterium]
MAINPKHAFATLALGVAATLAFGAASASAATISVTTTSDPASPVCPSSNNCSFRGAVAAASAGDVISLPAGTYAITQGEVLATKALTINGAGRDATLLDASALTPSNSSRALRIAGAASTVTTVANLSVTGGRVQDGSRAGGGGIRCNSRAGIVLSNVHIYDNSVTSTDDPADYEWIGGGGVWSIGTTIIKRNSLIEDNTVTVAASIGESGGGGVMVGGDYPGANLIISNSTVSRNTANADGVGSVLPVSRDGGGGVYVASNDLVLNSAVISGNATEIGNSWGESGGGGAYVSRGSLIASNAVIDANTADVTNTNSADFNPVQASNDGGGGVYVAGLNATFDNSEVTGNEAYARNSYGESGGGGVYMASRDIDSGTYKGDIRATRSTFSDNTAWAFATTNLNAFSSHYGGGAIYQDSHDLILSQVTLSGNAARVAGPSQAQEQYSVNGGGAIYQYGNMTSISRSTFSGNFAFLPLASRSGGGALMDNAQSSFITNSTFSGNRVTFTEDATEFNTNGGGAIFYSQESDGAVLANNTIASNRVNGSGGGALLPYSTEVRVGNTILSSNSASLTNYPECMNTDGIVDLGYITSLGYNLTNDTTDSCGLDATGDRTGNARLGSLAFNGGFTKTRAIGKKSAALDRGNPTGCETAFGARLKIDQRGYKRPWPKGGRCDIGAFEWHPAKKKPQAVVD